MPSGQARRLQELSISGTARAMLVAYKGAAAIKALTDAGIRATAFKGVGLLANLYPTAADRTVGDVDLLIDEADLSATCQTLYAIGFSPQIDIPVQEWLTHISRRIHPTHGYIVFMSDDKVELDIHWRLGIAESRVFSTQAILERAENVLLFRTPMNAAAPLDAMALTVHHVIRDYFRPGTTVKDLCDLSAWWEARDRWRAADMTAYVLRCGLSEALMALWSLLNEYAPEHRIASGIALLSGGMTEKSRADARHLKNLFYRQLREGALDPILVGMVHFNVEALMRFFKYELKIRTRKTSFKNLTQQKNEARLPLSSRLLRLIRLLAGMTPKRLAMYRAAVDRRIFFQGGYEKQNRE